MISSSDNAQRENLSLSYTMLHFSPYRKIKKDEGPKKSQQSPQTKEPIEGAGKKGKCPNLFIF